MKEKAEESTAQSLDFFVRPPGPTDVSGHYTSDVYGTKFLTRA